MGDTQYDETDEPLPTRGDIELACSAAFTMGSRERGEAWRTIWARWFPGVEYVGDFGSLLTPAEHELPSVRQRLDESLDALDWRRQARKWLERSREFGYSDEELKHQWTGIMKSIPVKEELDKDNQEIMSMIFEGVFNELIAAKDA
jgi:hypothetical protein